MAALSDLYKIIGRLCEANCELGLYTMRLQSEFNEVKERMAEIETELAFARGRIVEFEESNRTSAEPAQKGNNG